MTDPPSLSHALGEMDPVTLDEVMRLADLQVRLDRKYLVPVHLANQLLNEFAGSLKALEIESRRAFAYESTYFDTPDMLAYRLHARDRPLRFKVRTRAYLDSTTAMVEVKTEGSRGRTVKARAQHPFEARDQLTPAALRFVRAQLESHVIAAEALCLSATVVTAYSRSTLVDPSEHYRVTLDADLTFADTETTISGPADMVLVESKSPSRPTPVDRWLWRHKVRPVSVSKYCVGAAALNPSLPASRWARVLRRHFDWEPASPADVGASA